jgi:hypothetical protein
MNNKYFLLSVAGQNILLQSCFPGFPFTVVLRAVNPKSDNHEMVFFIPQRHENLAFKSERIAFSRLPESYTSHNGVTCYGFFKGHFAVSTLIYLQPVMRHWTGICPEWAYTRPVGWRWLWHSAEWKDSYQFQVPIRVSQMRSVTILHALLTPGCWGNLHHKFRNVHFHRIFLGLSSQGWWDGQDM